MDTEPVQPSEIQPPTPESPTLDLESINTDIQNARQEGITQARQAREQFTTQASHAQTHNEVLRSYRLTTGMPAEFSYRHTDEQDQSIVDGDASIVEIAQSTFEQEHHPTLHAYIAQVLPAARVNELAGIMQERWNATPSRDASGLMLSFNHNNQEYTLRYSGDKTGGRLYLLDSSVTEHDFHDRVEIYQELSELLTGENRLMLDNIRESLAQNEWFDQLSNSADILSHPAIAKALENKTNEIVPHINTVPTEHRDDVLHMLTHSARQLPSTLAGLIRKLPPQATNGSIDSASLTKHLNDTDYVFSRGGDSIVNESTFNTTENSNIHSGTPLAGDHGLGIFGTLAVQGQQEYLQENTARNGRVYYRYRPGIALQCKYYDQDVDDPDSVEIAETQDTRYYSFVDAQLARSLFKICENEQVQFGYMEGKSGRPILVRPEDVASALVPEQMIDHVTFHESTSVETYSYTPTTSQKN